MNSSRTAPTQSAAFAARPAARRRIRGAATAGLLAACALTTLSVAGTAHADGVRPEPTVSVPSQERPTAVPSSPGRDATQPPSSRPSASRAPSSAEPTQPPGDATAPRPVPSESRPGGTRAGADATPAPASGKDELAHTGASETTTLILGAGAAALLVAGGGTLYAVRRNRA
ncbi:LAETG motif-containing sortase-dependent surface protein [Streptomyces sp. BBFR2]|uniref:LAETG motif-containing sortase-dependent surface protein n=1 Tax=Streptomyces sp. BBFR2 TaxID=3372854 RepID=UPI0037DA4415